MSVEGTEETLTIDANVIHYYRTYLAKGTLPPEFGVSEMENFSTMVLEKYPIAINTHIETDYAQALKGNWIYSWLKERNKNKLTKNVQPIPLRTQVKKCLNNDYGFDCRSKDMRYLQTCKNTIFKKLITQNTVHFFLSHKRSLRRGTMDRYLKRKEYICIHTIDDCCSILLAD